MSKKYPARVRSTRRRAFHVDVDFLEERRLLNYNLLGAEWSQPARVTYSLMPDGTDLGGVPSNLQAALDGNPATAATWRTLIQKAAATWENSANVNLVQVADNGSPLGVAGNQQNDPRFGDIRIGGYVQRSGQLAFTFAPPPINGDTSAGDILFNTGQTWNTNGNPYDFYSVAMHEFGHALGLSHDDSQTTSVMWPTYNGAKSGLASDDKAGIAAVYGTIPADRIAGPQGNGTISTASDLTPYLDGNNQIALGGLELTKAYDLHYFKVTVPANTSGTMSIQVQATGLSSVIPALKVYDGQNVYTGYSSTQTAYSSTASVTMTGVRPGQVYKIMVNSGTTGPGFGGTYGLSWNLGATAQVSMSPPNTTVPQQPDQSIGTYAQGTGWMINGQFVPYGGDIGTLGGAGNSSTKAAASAPSGASDGGLYAVHIGDSVAYVDACMADNDPTPQPDPTTIPPVLTTVDPSAGVLLVDPSMVAPSYVLAPAKRPDAAATGGGTFAS
jgi:hypothetical protein